MIDRINIVIASDINYAPYYGVLLTSLFSNNREVCFDIYLLTDNTWTDKCNAKFCRLAQQHNSSFHVIRVDASKMKNFPVATHITLPSYYNMEACRLLPDNIHKVIYLDGDMIINGSIKDVWNINLEGYACAAVDDCSYYDEDIYRRLDYPKSFRFFNNGLTLFNLDYLRKIDFAEEAINYLTTNADRILWMDQDVENAMLAKVKKTLPLQYNFQTLFLLDYHWKNYSQEFRNRVLEASKYPIVIHYCGRIKPWHFKYWHHPYAQLWHKYRKMSPWKDAVVRKPIGKYVKFEALKILKRKQLLNKVHQEYIPQAWNLYAY